MFFTADAVTVENVTQQMTREHSALNNFYVLKHPWVGENYADIGHWHETMMELKIHKNKQ